MTYDRLKPEPKVRHFALVHSHAAPYFWEEGTLAGRSSYGLLELVSASRWNS